MGKLASKLKSERRPFVSAVIVAGGSGARFGGDKMMVPLAGAPVLAHTLRAFQASPMIDEIILVAREPALAAVATLCQEHGISKTALVVAGGEERIHSCYAGVMSTSEKAGIIAIHDGARPLVTEKIIEDAVWAAYRQLAAAPAIPLRDTIKRAENGVVTETPERAGLFAVQTPQCFRAELIRAALQDAVENAPGITDDCMAVERIGGKIFLTEGSEENIKITTPLDLELAELILKRREQA